MRVTEVSPEGMARRAGVRAGDNLTAIGEHGVRDSLDLAFALGWIEQDTALYRFRRAEDTYEVSLPVTEPRELGLEFAEDAQMTCGNRCVFCFVDQLPRGLRRSLYVKDEDYRLSFTHGNYITLTNLGDDDYERIARQRLSPLYISVHATSDVVRRSMLGNELAPPIMDGLKRLAGSGIAIHAQVVVCPGVNDGAVFENTLRDLHALGGAVLSIAVVPVGLTEHREGLPTVRGVTGAEAAALLESVRTWQQVFRRAERGNTVFAADELYLLAKEKLPPLEHYDELPQLENGVGLLRSFEADLRERAPMLESAIDAPLTVTVVTGELAAGFLRAVLGETLGRIANLESRVIPVRNTLLGGSVTVAGLLPGADMARAMGETPDEGLVLFPSSALNSEGLTIDDMTVGDIAGMSGKDNVIATDDVVSAILSHVGCHGTDPGNGASA